MDYREKRIHDLKAMAVNRCISGSGKHGFANFDHNYNTNCPNAEHWFSKIDGKRYLTVEETRELRRLEVIK